MKKVYVILLGMILAFCGNAYAGDINDVSSDKWLDHVAQMQVMRQQILNLLTRENPTAEDREMLAALQKSFSEKKTEWDQYLVDVAEGRIKGTKPVTTFCTDCGKKLCDCGKGIECKKCGKKVCNCAKACSGKSCLKDCSSHKKGKYHRYDKKPRRHFKKEYHRYNKKCKDTCDSIKKSDKDCCTPDYSCKTSCSSKKQGKKMMKMSCESSCSSHKHGKKMMKMSCKTSCSSHKAGKKMMKMSCKTSCSSHKAGKKMMKKTYKKSACGSCPSMKKSSCASSACNEKVAKCNGGSDCPSCPNYKTDKCCKVSGKCSSGDKKHYQKKADKAGKCPVCYEYKIMGINRKCARCSK